MHARTKMLTCRNREIYTLPSTPTTKCGTLKTRLDVDVRYAYLQSIGLMAALRGDGEQAMISKWHLQNFIALTSLAVH